jgi:hypothetical protein
MMGQAICSPQPISYTENESLHFFMGFGGKGAEMSLGLCTFIIPEIIDHHPQKDSILSSRLCGYTSSKSMTG